MARKLVVKPEEGLRVSFSRIKCWRHCHKQHDYRYNQRLKKKRPPLPLIRGKLIGELLDSLAQDGGKFIDLTFEAWAREYAELFFEEREVYGDLLSDLRRMLEGYRVKYAKDGLKYMDRGDGRKSEIPLEYTLEDGTIFVGYIDKMPKDKDGNVWVMDHKSHRVIPDEDARFSDLQLVVYCWLAPLCGYPTPYGVIWDYIRTKAPAIPELLKDGKALSKRANIDTTYETYLATIKQHGFDPADYKEILDSLKSQEDSFYRRVNLPSPSQSMINEVVRDYKISIAEIKNMGEINDSRNMTRDCKQCSYYLLCQTELRGLDSTFVRKSDYEVSDPDGEKDFPIPLTKGKSK